MSASIIRPFNPEDPEDPERRDKVNSDRHAQFRDTMSVLSYMALSGIPPGPEAASALPISRRFGPRSAGAAAIDGVNSVDSPDISD